MSLSVDAQTLQEDTYENVNTSYLGNERVNEGIGIKDFLLYLALYLLNFVLHTSIIYLKIHSPVEVY